MINFSEAKEILNNYKGSEKKKTLIYNSKRYLVKFPDPIREKNRKLSYINNAFSEYIGSNIFKIIGFRTQKTLLGTYTYNGKEKVVCACEDFTDENHILYEFESIALSTNPDKKIGTDINDIMTVIDEAEIIVIKDVKAEFWNMFLIDGLIGNTDRHNGNWGFLSNRENDKLEIAPIYDCGSCLNPMLEDKELEKISETEIKNIAVNCYSCIREDGKKINYMAYIKDAKNEECNSAVKKIFPKIDIRKINSFIDGIYCMSVSRKEFYKKIICYRYEIIRDTYKRINKC